MYKESNQEIEMTELRTLRRHIKMAIITIDSIESEIPQDLADWNKSKLRIYEEYLKSTEEELMTAYDKCMNICEDDEWDVLSQERPTQEKRIQRLKTSLADQLKFRQTPVVGKKPVQIQSQVQEVRLPTNRPRPLEKRVTVLSSTNQDVTPTATRSELSTLPVENHSREVLATRSELSTLPVENHSREVLVTRSELPPSL